MTKVQLGILSAILVAGSLVSWRIQHSARMQLRERAEALRQQGDLLALWSAENDTLSNLVARGRIPASN